MRDGAVESRYGESDPRSRPRRAGWTAWLHPDWRRRLHLTWPFTPPPPPHIRRPADYTPRIVIAGGRPVMRMECM